MQSTKEGPISRWDQFASACAVMASLLSGKRLYPSPQICPGPVIQGMEEGIGGNVTSLLVVLTNLEHENPKG